MLLSSCQNVRTVQADFISLEGDNVASPISSYHHGIDIHLDMGDSDITYQAEADAGALYFNRNYARLMILSDDVTFQWSPDEYLQDNYVDIIAYDYDRIVGCGAVKISKGDDGWLRGEVIYCVTFGGGKEIDEENAKKLIEKAKNN